MNNAKDSGTTDSSFGGAAWRLTSLLRSLRSLLLPVSLADGSGYNAMTPLAPSSPSAAAAAAAAVAAAAGSGAGADDKGDDGNGSDTITGVFHRLDTSKARLVLVQVVFRHGARTPLSRDERLWEGVDWDVCGEAYKAAAVRLFSTSGVEDPFSKNDAKQRKLLLPGGCFKGELTLVGQEQARELGRRLRERYVEGAALLPTEHQPGLLEARTTNVSRTRASLRGVLTGLYPDLAAAAEGGGAKEPQRVTTSGDLDEILFADARACPHLGAIMALAKENGRALLRSDPDYEWARAELGRLLGISQEAFDTKPWVFTDLHDILVSLEAHGKPLPAPLRGLSPEHRRRLLEAIDRLATREFSSEVAPGFRDATGRTVLRLSMGRLLSILTANMRSAAEKAAAGKAAAGKAAAGASGGGDKEGPRMYMYSGHDSTIMPLLAALGHDVVTWPPYMTNIAIELWELPPLRGQQGQQGQQGQGQQGAEAASTPASPAPAPGSAPGSPAPAPGSASAGSASAGSAPGSPRYAVRVLRNLEELPLPHCPAGYFPSLATFEREVVGPFLLSAERYESLCAARLEHEGAMPHPRPKAKPAAHGAAPAPAA